MPLFEEKSVGERGFNDYTRKFGRCGNINTESVVWDGATNNVQNQYDGWLPSEEDIEWFSTSEEDKPGGTGVSDLFFTGQGDDGLNKVFVGKMNGTTPVRISQDVVNPDVRMNIIFTAQAINLDVGNANLFPLVDQGCANAGQITIRSVTTQKIMAIILPNLGRTQMMIWRCESNAYGKFRKIDVYHTDNQPTVFKLMGRRDKTRSWICLGQIDMEDNVVKIKHPLPDYIEPGTDLCLTADPGSGGTSISAQMWIERIPI